MPDPASQSLFELIALVLRQSRDHLRSECSLACAEIADHLGSLRAGVAMIVLAVVLLTPALTILLGGIVGALAKSGLRGDLAAVLVGGGTLIAGGLLFVGGIARINTVSFVPTKAIEQFNRDLAAFDNWSQKS